MSDGRNYTDEDYRQLHSAHCVTEAQRAAAVKEIERLREDWFQREKVLKDPVAVFLIVVGLLTLLKPMDH